MAGVDDSYLLAVSLYIHLNPVRAALVPDPLSYRWSSCRLYYEDNAPKSFVDPDFILRLLSGDGIENKKRYRLLLKQSRELETAHVLEQEDAIERFRSKIASMFPSLFKIVDKKRQIAKFLGIDLPGMEELEKLIEAVGKENSSSKPESRKAKKFLIEQLISRGYTRAEIAERLGVCITQNSLQHLESSTIKHEFDFQKSDFYPSEPKAVLGNFLGSISQSFLPKSAQGCFG